MIRVLIVDDTDHVREMLTQMLTLDGFQVVAAAPRGADGVERATALRPDVVIMDLKMPEMDGIAATRALRAAGLDCPVILYTAYLDAAIEREAREAGVTRCIGKVEGIDSLEREISALCLELVHG